VLGLDERIAAADDRSGLAAHLAGFSPDPNDCVTICWTSGTESTPKGIPDPAVRALYFPRIAGRIAPLRNTAAPEE